MIHGLGVITLLSAIPTVKRIENMINVRKDLFNRIFNYT
jgi:hypothetical protein